MTDQIPEPNPDLLTRVEEWIDANGVQLAQPLGRTTLQVMAADAGATEAETLQAIDALRASKGISVTIATDTTPAADAAVDVTHSELQARVLEQIQARGIDLSKKVPAKATEAIAQTLEMSERSVRGAVQRLREKTGHKIYPSRSKTTAQARAKAPKAPRPARSGQGELPLAPAGHAASPPPPEVFVPTNLEPRALALTLVHQLLQVTSAERPHALIEGSKLLRRIL